MMIRRIFVGGLAALLLLGLAVAAEAAETVSIGSGSLGVGETVELSIVLDHAPQGLSGYILTVSLSDGGAVARIESVAFVAFSGASRAEIAPGGGSANIRATDFSNAVQPGDSNIVLARITFRGLAEGSSQVALQLNQFDADNGADLLPSTTTQAGSLTVIPTGSPTLRPGSASATVGGSVQIPITLDRAPQGLAGYIMTLSSAIPAVAKIEAVEFVAFDYASRAEISPDGAAAEIRAADLGAAVQPGATDITLARVTFRALAEGSSEITLQLTKFDADDGTDLLPSTTIAKGAITVTSGISDTTPPQFANPQPSPNSVVATSQPTISIEISDETGVDPDSIQITVADSSGAEHAFATTAAAARPALEWSWKARPAALFAAHPSASGLINLSVKATVDLRAAGLSLAEGSVTVTASARDRAGNRATTSWTFTVARSGGGDLTPPQFANKQPAPGSTIADPRPVISVKITDSESGVDQPSISLKVDDSRASRTFTVSSAGASFSSGVFSVDLRAAGIALASGSVTITAAASDNAGNRGSASWSFSVQPLGIKPGDVNGDGIVDKKDASLVSKYAFTGRGLDGSQLPAANVARPCGPPHDRSTINSKDATHITQAAVGIRKEFECFPGVAIGSSSAQALLKAAEVTAYPNPLRSPAETAHLMVDGEGIAAVRVEVFDLSGRLVFASPFVAKDELTWRLTDASGALLANGVYLYVATIRGEHGELVRSKPRRLVVLRQ
jgi:hypothetical protein